MKQYTYKGLLSRGHNGEEDILCLSSNSEAFASDLQDDIGGKTVTVRYWIANAELTRDQLQEAHLLSISGAAHADYGMRYSDYTGYLWTDEKIDIGGHDLLEELTGHIGKYLYLEVDVHE